MPAPVLPTGQQFTIRRGDQLATAVELGGGLRSYAVAGRELLDSFAEAEPVTNSRGQVLAPWPNRIEGGRYRWEGAAHQLALTEPARGNATHGLLRFVRWECVRHEADEVVLAQHVLPQPGYPFTLAVEVAYRLTDGGLEVTTTARNVGDAPLPYASGQHPYLAPLGGAHLDDCTVQLRAATFLPTDERGIPLEPQAVEGSAVDLCAPRSLGDLQLDTAFTDLARDSDGRATVRLSGPGGAATELWVGAAYPWVQLFTGDTLAPARRRGGLAVEPMTAPPDAFRSGTDLVRLEPGGAATATWGLRAV